MKRKVISMLLAYCLASAPAMVYAEDIDISNMSLEELQSAYLNLQEKYNALLNETADDSSNDNTSGETIIETGNFIFTLDSVVQCNSIPGAFGDTVPDNPENIFLIFNITAENIGSEDDYINIFYSSGYADGYAIDPSTILSSGVEQFAGDIAAGRKRAGSIVFEVSSDWKECEYLYQNDFENIKASFIATPDTVTVE